MISHNGRAVKIKTGYTMKMNYILIQAMTLFLFWPLLSCQNRDQNHPLKQNKKTSQEEKLTRVQFEQFSKKKLYDEKIFAGRLQLAQWEDIYAPLSGIAYEKTQKNEVRKGQILWEIKPDSHGLNYNSLKITSPITGYLYEKTFEHSSHVANNQKLARIGVLGNYKTSFFAGLKDYELLKVGNELEAAIAGKLAEGLNISAKITDKSINLDPVTKAFSINAAILCNKTLKCPKDLPIGAFIRLTLKSNLRDSIVINQQYLHKRNEKVMILKDDQTFDWQEVKTGQFLGEYVEILSGINEQSKIITHFSKWPQKGEILIIENKKQEEDVEPNKSDEGKVTKKEKSDNTKSNI